MGGVVGFNWEDRSLGKRMSLSQARQGANEIIFSESGITIGFRSRNNPRQPATNEDEDVFLFFDGDLLNPEEMRAKLKGSHRIRNDDSSELLVHAYEELGEQVLIHANTTSAICIYDRRKKQLLLARDKMGLSSMFYHFNNGHLAFASELRSILEINTIKRDIDTEALNHYFLFGFNPLEQTMISGVKKLLPGHMLKADITNKTLSVEKYWSIKDKAFGGKMAEFEEREKSLLTDALERKGKGAAGMLLYGKESLIMLSLLDGINMKIKERSRNQPNKPTEPNELTEPKESKIMTFSINFSDSPKKELEEERAYVDRICKRFGNEHKEFLIGSGLLRFVPPAIASLDEPIANPDMMASYLLLSGAKSSTGKILCSAGAAELFMMKKSSSKIRSQKKGFFAKIFGEKKDSGVESVFCNHHSQSALFSEEERAEMLTKEYYQSVDLDEYGKGFSDQADPSKGLVFFDITRVLPETDLSFSRSFAADNSLELFNPFLDYRFAEMAFSLKASARKEEYEELAKKIIPQGLTPPVGSRDVADLIFGKEFKPEQQDILNITRIYKKGIINPYYVKKIISEYNEGKTEWSRQLFAIVCFELWHRLYIEREKI